MHKYVFLFGGTGAGHEDVSMPAVAKAMGSGMEQHPELLRAVVNSVSPADITEWHLKMADFPFGSELIGPMPEIAVPGQDCSWNKVLVILPPSPLPPSLPSSLPRLQARMDAPCRGAGILSCYCRNTFLLFVLASEAKR